jgi:hypothetical protein
MLEAATPLLVLLVGLLLVGWPRQAPLRDSASNNGAEASARTQTRMIYFT